jgi:predicted MPP superfamily phosphohydrolase
MTYYIKRDVLGREVSYLKEGKNRVVIVLLFGLLALLCYLYIQVNWIAIKKYTVSINDLHPNLEGTTILHISDLHNKRYGKEQSKLVKLINTQKFDLVVITGDLIDRRKPKIDPINELLKNLNTEPIYFVPGNHERATGFTVKEQLLEAGVRILENRAEKFAVGEGHLWIVGVDDPYSGRDRLDKALADTDDSAPRLLLSHAPNIYPAAIRKDIDLVLAGHTHGGQIRFPFWGAVIAPGQGLLPKWDYGMYKDGETSMIINGGLGESMYPIRFNNRPELVVVTLIADH